MKTPIIACVNKATVDMGVDFTRLINALQLCVTRHFAPLWGGLDAVLIETDDLVSGAWGMVFTDDADVAGALGYHDRTPEGLPLSHIFVKTTLKYGDRVSVTACHEVLEMLGNPDVDQWVPGPAGAYARENCDQVEGDEWEMPEFPGIRMSDFALPAWFDAHDTSGRYDYLGLTKRPFEIRPQGYMPVRRNGQITQIFGSLEAAGAFRIENHRRVRQIADDLQAWRYSSPSVLCV